MSAKTTPNNVQESQWDIPTDSGTVLAAGVSCSMLDPTGAVTALSVTNPSTNRFRTTFTFVEAATLGWYVFRWRCNNPIMGLEDYVLLQPAATGARV